MFVFNFARVEAFCGVGGPEELACCATQAAEARSNPQRTRATKRGELTMQIMPIHLLLEALNFAERKDLHGKATAAERIVNPAVVVVDPVATATSPTDRRCAKG
jgi:hypothetical protein